MADDTAQQDFTPAHFPFATLTRLLDRMEQEGLPAIVDKSYVSNLPWGYQGHFLGVLRTHGLTDADGRPTELLTQMVTDPGARASLLARVMREHYSAATGLDPNATQGQLEEVFKGYGISGSTLRKAITFYLSATKYAGIDTSPHFRSPRAPSNQRRPSAKRGAKAIPVEAPPPQVTPPSNPYADLHPFLQGLIRELPAMGESWSESKRTAWLEIAERTVDMLYPIEDLSAAADLKK